ncbi:TIM barrel protein, partial [Mycobacterium sp. NAZ190054]|uniref:TIM barrel protein n=1 Tax=Mycobacterium sp. NAZ190054 TaxID=1747766 RepID=UPI000B11D41C
MGILFSPRNPPALSFDADAAPSCPDARPSPPASFCPSTNTIVDHPGVPLARAKDTLALVEGVGHPNVKMMLDLYHAQIGEGNLTELVRRCGDAIGEIQVADVPGRCEPGTGELNYAAVAAALREAGYTGTVGMEAWASKGGVAGSEAALAAFRTAFS